MILTRYSIEEQKVIVRRWNHYYGKGLRTMEDLEHFDKLVDSRLDDLLRLIALEVTSDFYQCFEGWDPKDSLCNLLYQLDVTQTHKGGNIINKFLDSVTDYFNQVPFKKSQEEIIERALDFILQAMNKENVPAPDGGTIRMYII